MVLLKTFFANHKTFFIQQKKEWAEIITSFEQKNQYALFDAQKNQLGTIVERAGDHSVALKRIFFKRHRPFDVDVFDNNQQPTLHLSRKFMWFFSHITVSTPEGQLIGKIDGRFKFWKKYYELKDANETVFAVIISPFWKILTFPLYLQENTEPVGKISKKWSGTMREMFTDADTFMIDTETHSWTPEQQAIILAAGMVIDFDFFENNRTGLKFFPQA